MAGEPAWGRGGETVPLTHQERSAKGVIYLGIPRALPEPFWGPGDAQAPSHVLTAWMRNTSPR